jgi:hypothetical protein
MISHRFELLAQAFRVFAEQYFRFRPLFLIDAPEAVGNLDHAIDGILNAFHGLYDATKLEAPGAFEFYGEPLCSFILWLRNARHHNKANGLRSIYRCARDQEARTDYLLVDFAEGHDEEGGSFGAYYVAWADILTVLALQAERYAYAVAASRDAIGAAKLEAWCAEHGYSEQQIFINLIPILAAAGTACIGSLVNYIRPQSVEAEAFLNIFQNVQPANFQEQHYAELTSAAFWSN